MESGKCALRRSVAECCERMLQVVAKLNVKPQSNTHTHIHTHTHTHHHDHLTGHVNTRVHRRMRNVDLFVLWLAPCSSRDAVSWKYSGCVETNRVKMRKKGVGAEPASTSPTSLRKRFPAMAPRGGSSLCAYQGHNVVHTPLEVVL